MDKNYIQDWTKKNTVMFPLRFNKVSDAVIIKHLKAQKNRTGYIRELIKADIERKA